MSEIRKVVPVQGVAGDITLHHYEPLAIGPEAQYQEILTERFIREGGTVYRDGKPWATALPAEPKDDGAYTAQLIPLTKDET